MLYLTCTTITSLDLAHYGVSRAKDWVSVDCGTISPLYESSFQTLSVDMTVLISGTAFLKRYHGVL